VTKQQRQADNAIHEDQLLNVLVNALTGAFGISIDTVRSVGNTLLREYTLEMLPEQVELVVDFHLRPYYGDEDETDGLYYSEAKRGTTAFHAYATLYARVKNKRYTLAVRRVTHGDTASEVLAEFLGLVDDFDFDVKAVYVDREFYDGKCLTLMQAHNHAYVVPIVKWGTKIKMASMAWRVTATPSTRRSSTHRDRLVTTTANASGSKQRTVFRSRH
jgi:hypothetical protein